MPESIATVVFHWMAQIDPQKALAFETREFSLIRELRMMRECTILPAGALETPKTGQDRGSLVQEVKSGSQIQFTSLADECVPVATAVRDAHAICSTCGQPRGRHHAETLACPKDPRFDLRNQLHQTSS